MSGIRVWPVVKLTDLVPQISSKGAGVGIWPKSKGEISMGGITHRSQAWFLSVRWSEATGSRPAGLAPLVWKTTAFWMHRPAQQIQSLSRSGLSPQSIKRGGPYPVANRLGF